MVGANASIHLHPTLTAGTAI